MTAPVIIVLAGEVVAKGRPRFAMRGAGQRPIAYTPGKTRNYEGNLRFAAMQAMDGRTLLNGPLIMRITASLPIPGSWSKKKQIAAANGLTQPTKRPDIDNFIKIAMDALNCVVFADDNQIIELVARKEYSDRPRLQIIVAPWSHWTERRAAA